MKSALKRTSSAHPAASFFTDHQLIIGLLLVFLGLADLCFVKPNPYGAFSGFVDWQTFHFYMPGYMLVVPVLLLIALVGTLILSIYCVTDIQPARVNYKEHAALLVNVLGFTYLVIGAWPLWSQSYPWAWQQKIASYGNLLVLPLYIGSLLAFATGAVSLYVHSRIYHQQHPEILANVSD